MKKNFNNWPLPFLAAFGDYYAYHYSQMTKNKTQHNFGWKFSHPRKMQLRCSSNRLQKLSQITVKVFSKWNFFIWIFAQKINNVPNKKLWDFFWTIFNIFSEFWRLIEMHLPWKVFDAKMLLQCLWSGLLLSIKLFLGASFFVARPASCRVSHRERQSVWLQKMCN